MRAEPNRFLVYRLNHSATTACGKAGYRTYAAAAGEHNTQKLASQPRGGHCRSMVGWLQLFLLLSINCIRGRVVKAMDLKSIGLCPHRFESCRMRNFVVNEEQPLSETQL